MVKNMELRKLLNFFDFDYDSTDVNLLKITNENKKELEIRQNCFKNEKDLSGPMIYLIDNQGGQELSLIRFFITEDTVKNIVKILKPYCDEYLIKPLSKHFNKNFNNLEEIFHFITSQGFKQDTVYPISVLNALIHPETVIIEDW